MIKFLSNAMLSVFMDKDARQKLKKRKKPDAKAKPAKGKKQTGAGEKAAPSKAERQKQAIEGMLAAEPEVKQKAIEELLQAKLAKAAQDGPPAGRAPGGAKGGSKGGTKGEMDRERLIQTALAVQKAQSHILDNVDDAVKERVRRLAAEKLLGDGGTKH